MTRQVVITEKASQARDVRAAVGSRYGTVLAAEGHLFDLCEPEDANPAWKRWSTELLKPDGLYGTKPATGGNKAAKLKAIRAALKTADRVWLGFDAVKHLLLARIEKRPARLDLSRYPHLPQPFVAATRSADYATLLAGGAGHG